MSDGLRELIKETLDNRSELSPCLDIDCNMTRLMVAKELEQEIKSNFNLNKKNQFFTEK